MKLHCSCQTTLNLFRQPVFCNVIHSIAKRSASLLHVQHQHFLLFHAHPSAEGNSSVSSSDREETEHITSEGIWYNALQNSQIFHYKNIGYCFKSKKTKLQFNL